MSRLINGNRTAEDIIRAHLEKRQHESHKPKPKRKRTKTQPAGTTSLIIPSSIVLNNISCVDMSGRQFEHYDQLHVATDVVRGNENYPNSTAKKHFLFTPYQGIRYFEHQNNGFFLPSFALTCNIVAALYNGRNDPAFAAVLQQYNNYGAGYGWHGQNTLVNWGAQQIVHYPQDSDFPQHGGTQQINQSQLRTLLSFDRRGFADTTLETALQQSTFKQYVQDLTGLADPNILIEIARYFGKTARVWVSSSDDLRAAWFGYSYLNLDASSYLSGSGAVRGVSRR